MKEKGFNMEFKTQNGNVTVEILPASFKDASNLKKAITKGLVGSNLLDNVNTANLMDIKIDSIVQILVNIDTSDEFERAVMECLKCCIYDKGVNNLKITPQLFDDIPDAREDYYEIITKCCEENLRPFFKSLVSEFKTRFQMISQNLEQK